MTIIFENDSDVIVDALEKIISFAKENQYLFVANCAWWIARVIGLDNGLLIYINNSEARRNKVTRPVSSMPRDIARSVSADTRLTIIEKEINSNPRDGVRKLSKSQRRKEAKQPRPAPARKLSKSKRWKEAK